MSDKSQRPNKRTRVSTSSSASSVIEMANLSLSDRSGSSSSSQSPSSSSESLKSPITPVSPDQPSDAKIHRCDTCRECLRSRRGSLLKSVQNADPRVGYAPSESAKEATMLPTFGVLPDQYGENTSAPPTVVSAAQQIKRYCEDLDAIVRRRLQQEKDVIREGLASFDFPNAASTSRPHPTVTRTPSNASTDSLSNMPSKINSVASSVRYAESDRSSRWASDSRCASACRTPSCTSSVRRSSRFFSSSTWSRASIRGRSIAHSIQEFFRGASSVDSGFIEESLTVKAAAYEKYKTHGQSNPNLWVKDLQDEEFRRTMEMMYRGRGSLENVRSAKALANKKTYKLRSGYGMLVV